MIRAFLFAVGLSLTSLNPIALAQDDESNVIAVSDENVAMNAAIAQARETLPIFWELYDANPGYEDAFAIKAGLPTNDDSIEHIWVGDLARKKGQITGTLGNVPVDLVGDPQLGDTVSFTADEVSDWTIWSGDKQLGGFTIRVIADMMGPEERDALLDMLHEDPLP